MKKLFIGISIAFGTLVLLILLLIYFNVFWLLAPQYEVNRLVPLEVPVMDMKSYEDIMSTHRRPYIFILKSVTGGEVCILGVEHSKDPARKDLDSILHYWKNFDPDIALVEGRVGNLFRWLQDPLTELGEGGLVTDLANKKNIPVYSWEPKRKDEIEILMKTFAPKEIAMFYTFRPYFSNMRYGGYSDAEAALQDYLKSRTDYPHLKGVFKSWQELDQKWQTDFPEEDWRNYGSGRGYPDGYLHEIWNHTNLMRDHHMISIIVELVSEGNRVYVIMGSSHAPRIEGSLKSLIN